MVRRTISPQWRLIPTAVSLTTYARRIGRFHADAARGILVAKIAAGTLLRPRSAKPSTSTEIAEGPIRCNGGEQGGGKIVVTDPFSRQLQRGNGPIPPEFFQRRRTNVGVHLTLMLRRAGVLRLLPYCFFARAGLGVCHMTATARSREGDPRAVNELQGELPCCVDPRWRARPLPVISNRCRQG